MREVQADLTKLCRQLDQVSASLIQIAAELPGGKELDVPGAYL